MNAMTWWDHETSSIWSQPWGMAIDGPLNGTRLKLISASVVPWTTWLGEHPETLLLEVGQQGITHRERFSDNYVIGITLGEYAKAYAFRPASQEGVVNDQIGPFPVVVIANSGTKAVHVYLRMAGDKELDFSLLDGRLVDHQTGSTWNVTAGIAVDGPLRVELLKQVPYSTAYDWAWEDFYPHSKFYRRSG